MSSHLKDFEMVVCCRRVPARRDEPHLVTQHLLHSGYKVHQVNDIGDGLKRKSVLWLLGNGNWYPGARARLLSRSGNSRPFTVLWQYEPLPPAKTANLPWPGLHWRELARIVRRDPGATDVYTNFLRLRQLARAGIPDLLVVSTEGRREFLAEQGISAERVPLGYAAQEHGQDLCLTRDIHVLFLGDLGVPRRTRLLRRLRRSGIQPMVMGNWSDPSCFGDNRTRILSRTRLQLNIQRYPGELSGYRLILGAMHGVLMVSEPMHQPMPFVPGVHYVESTIEEMPELIQYYLDNEDERARLVAQAQDLITRDVTMRQSVARILDLIDVRLGLRRNSKSRRFADVQG